MMESTVNTTASSSGNSPGLSDSWSWFDFIQLILALFGIFGNTLVIVVYVKKLRNRGNSSKLIVMLAVADLTTSIAIIPMPSLSYVPDTTAGRVYCIFTYSAVIMWISIIASIFTLTLLSLERYFAIVRPTRHKTVFSNRNVRFAVTSIWIVAVVINSNSLYITQVGENNLCALIWPSPAFQVFHGVCIFLVEFAVPVVVMVVSHYYAIRELQEQAKRLLGMGESTSSPAFSLLRCRRRVIRMVFVVVLIFIICWSPDQVAYILLNLNALPTDYFRSYAYRSFTLLAFVNSSANPIFYICFNKNFRDATIQLIPLLSPTATETQEEIN